MKISKYNTFLVESLQLINESNVVYSDKFRQVLSKIGGPIAQKLIEIENTDLPVRSNYFDVVPKKNDAINFMPDRKAQEILADKTISVRFIGSDAGWLRHSPANDEIFATLGYTPQGANPYRPNSSDIGTIISSYVSPTSGKTYCYVKFTDASGNELGQGVYNKEKLRETTDQKDKLWGRGRQEIGVGRGIRALLLTTGEKFLDKDIEAFVNLYKATLDKMNDKFSLFEVVDGDDIYHWYQRENYFEKKGQLGGSCMGSARESWLEIYTANPNRVKLIIMKSEDDDSTIVGRALLWTLRDGKRFMDRVYTIKDSDIQLFREYAKENGWYAKYHNSSTSNSQSIAPEGGVVNLDLTVILDQKYYDHFPYLDTLKHFTPGSGVLNNQSGEYLLEDTGGDYVRCEYCGGSGRQECGDCGGNGREDCYECDGSGTQECEECDGNGTQQCNNCDGSGEVEGDEGEMESCPECDGDGHQECDDCSGRGTVDCDRCDGDGYQECSNCGGEGEVDCYECN